MSLHDLDSEHERSPAEADSRRERIVETAARLFAERGASNVTVRDVADAAGVTHPLIYYYWSSKDELLASAVASSQSRMRRVPGAGGEPLEAVVAMIREALAHDGQYLKTLTRSLLDGMPPSEWPGGYPGVEAALRLLTADLEPGGELDAGRRERFASALAAMLGWSLVEEQLLEIVGLPPERAEHAREALFDSIRDILEPAVLRKNESPAGRREE